MLFNEPTHQDDLDEWNIKDRMGLVLVEDLVEVWGIVLNGKLTEEEIQILKEVTQEALQVYWGEEAWVEIKDGYLFMKHKDGRSIERFVAF